MEINLIFSYKTIRHSQKEKKKQQEAGFDAAKYQFSYSEKI